MTVGLPADPALAGPGAQPSDPLQRARMYWRGEHLGIDEESFIAMISVLRVHRLMTVAIEQAFKKHDIRLNDYIALATLEMSENGTRSISRLARALLVHPTTATLITDRLEARGLLARTPHPSDRRATLASITAAGRDLVERASAALGALGYGLAGASSADRGELVEAIYRVRAAIGDCGRATGHVDQASPA
jgi:DNA-binding MarR family transcriptional regulator